jgi:hypothetical protein
VVQNINSETTSPTSTLVANLCKLRAFDGASHALACPQMNDVKTARNAFRARLNHNGSAQGSME